MRSEVRVGFREDLQLGKHLRPSGRLGMERRCLFGQQSLVAQCVLCHLIASCIG